MKQRRYIVVCEMPDGSQKEFVSSEEIEVGSIFMGGKVKACRKLYKKYVE